MQSNKLKFEMKDILIYIMNVSVTELRNILSISSPDFQLCGHTMASNWIGSYYTWNLQKSATKLNLSKKKSVQDKPSSTCSKQSNDNNSRHTVLPI